VAWLIGGAAVDGIGTWSMHYTGKLALRLPVPLLFDWPTVVLSLLICIFGSGAAFLVVSRSRMGWHGTLLASFLMGGVGISGLHYISMEAMRLPGMHHDYDSPALVALSVALAVVFCFIPLSLTFLYADAGSSHLRYHGSTLLRGAANPVMHYTAMAAVIFVASNHPPDLSHAVSSESLGILGISIVPVMVLIVALLTSFADRLQKQRSLLDELFEQAPQAVALMTVDDRIVRVNSEFSRIFGYSSQEAVGRRLADLIVPDELESEARQFAEAVEKGQRIQTEQVRQRKDGNKLYVSIVRVPVSVPGGEIETYGIYRDISQERLADAALRENAQRLHVLSRRVVEVQEEERRHLARELHDEIGQVLSAISANLKALKSVADDAARPKLDDSIYLVDQATQIVHNRSLDLRPSMLDDLGLVATLRWLGTRQAERAGFQLHFVADTTGARLESALEIACYRIAQEAFTNIVRHAQAQQVWLDFHQNDEQVQIIIRDDGVGFDVATVRQQAASGASFGVLGMHERVELLGGQIEIVSGESQGTTIKVDFQLPPQSRSSVQ